MNKYPQAHIAREEGMAYVLTTGTCHECGPWSCLHFFQGCTVPQVCATSPLLAEEPTAVRWACDAMNHVSAYRQ